jgi:hypothetical protein
MYTRTAFELVKYVPQRSYKMMGVVANEMRKLLDRKTDAERVQLLASKKYRSWLAEVGILDEYYRPQSHTWVTIRLPKGKEPGYYKDALCVKLASVEWCRGGEAVLEGGDTTNPHIHLLLGEKRHKGNLIKRFAKLFGVSKEWIDHKVDDSVELKAKRSAYVRGDKVSAKADAVDQDRVYREAHGIPHLMKF